MKEDITTGQLQEAKLRKLDKSLIECRLLSEAFPLYLIREGGREAKLSELYKADHYISRWRKKLLRASLHSLRGSRTAHSWKSEGPYYLPNPSLRGTVDRKAPSKPPHSSKREGKGPMYLHDPCRFYPIYTRSQSPIGPAATPQNGSSCGTFYFWRNSGGT